MSKATVYVIGWRKQGPVKIGTAFNPVARLAELQCGSPYRLRIWFAAVVPAGLAHRAEVGCHRTLKASRMTGEWFSVTAMVAHSTLVAVIHDLGEPVCRWQPSGRTLQSRQAQLIGRRAQVALAKDSKDDSLRKANAIEWREWQRKQYASG